MKTENEIEELYMQYKHLVRATLKHQYPNYHDFAKSHGLDIDDLLQLGNIGLYKAVMDYNPQMGTSFKTYAINKISYALRSEPKQYSLSNVNNRSYEFSNNTSFDKPIIDQSGESSTLHDVLEENVDFIQDAEFNVLIDNIADKISPKLATAVKMKYENFTLKQIGEKLNMSSQGVNQMLKKNQSRLAELMLV